MVLSSSRPSGTRSRRPRCPRRSFLQHGLRPVRVLRGAVLCTGRVVVRAVQSSPARHGADGM
eukprot:9072131-Alexandrium_andersonii.AAC.1